MKIDLIVDEVVRRKKTITIERNGTFPGWIVCRTLCEVCGHEVEKDEECTIALDVHGARHTFHSACFQRKVR